VGNYGELISGARNPVVTRCACIAYVPPTTTPAPAPPVSGKYLMAFAGLFNDRL